MPGRTRRTEAFRDTLRGFGWIDGRNLRIEAHWPTFVKAEEMCDTAVERRRCESWKTPAAQSCATRWIARRSAPMIRSVPIIEPDDRSGDRATHGAARHGCLLIAETSCEIRILFLDRNLLVPAMANDGSSFFDNPASS